MMQQWEELSAKFGVLARMLGEGRTPYVPSDPEASTSNFWKRSAILTCRRSTFFSSDKPCATMAALIAVRQGARSTTDN